jgi:hypothetical protein
VHERYGQHHGDQIPTFHFHASTVELSKLLADRVAAHVSADPAPSQLVRRLADYAAAAAHTKSDCFCDKEADKTAHDFAFFGSMINAFISGGGGGAEWTSEVVLKTAKDVGPGTSDLQFGTRDMVYSVLADTPRLSASMVGIISLDALRGLRIFLDGDRFGVEVVGIAKATFKAAEMSILIQVCPSSQPARG